MNTYIRVQSTFCQKLLMPKSNVKKSSKRPNREAKSSARARHAHSLSISWRSQGVMDNKRPFIKLGSAGRHATGPLTQARSHRACLQSACFSLSLSVYGFFLLVSRNHARMSTRRGRGRRRYSRPLRACRGICGSLSRVNSSLAFA